MKHVFDPEKSEILESEERKKIEPVSVVMRKIENLERKEVAVEVGAGIGYYTVPLSKIFKRVYAIDLSIKMTEKLSKKLTDLRIKNVGIIVTDKPPDLDFPVDLILFANVLHEMDKPTEYLEWAKRSDHILIVDWKKVKMSFGPPFEERLSEREILEMIGTGFEVKELDSDSLPYHYIVFARSLK
jgi:protein-L-isoaspartate O-methyltransferase